MRVIDIFDVGANRHPDRDFVVEGEARWTHRQARTMSHKIANALAAAGIAPGAKVGTLSPNNALGLVAELGILRAGAVWLALNARNTLAETLYAVELADCEFLFFHSKYAAEARAVRAALPGLRGTVCLDRAIDEAPFILDWMAPHADEAPLVADDPLHPFSLMLTSGTTGRSKAVVLTNLMFGTLVDAWAAYFPHDEPPIHLCAAPLTHAAGAVAHSLFPFGGTHVILPELKPGLVLEAIERYRVNVLFLPPTVIYMLLAHPDLRKYDYSSLKYLQYAAAPMSSEKLKLAMEVFGPVMSQTYGQTEMPLAATIFTPAEHVAALADPALHHRLSSAGRPTHVCPIAIMDMEGRLLGPGETGEIVTRGKLVMREYYKNPKATEEVKLHGWHHTGDVGRIDEDGYVYILDRAKDMIISGGFNVYPNEVEQALMAEPEIAECAVIGVPDPKWGEMVIAVVEPRGGAVIDTEAVIARCKAQIGSIKAPKRIEIVEALPRNSNGKVLKREIRNPYWAGRDRKI